MIMDKKAAKYYLILDKLVGKSEGGAYYIFSDGHWEPDVNCEVMDRLYGYDPSDDSPYGYASDSILEEIQEISEEKAMELTGL